MELDRTTINRENAQFSTGPKTEEGKQRSAQNAFKHGLYSKALILPTENPKEFHELRESLFAEYQPATPSESILVDELVQNTWRIRRYRRLEISAIDAPHCEGGLNLPLMSIVERALASAQRAFHRSLDALTKLQRERKAREEKANAGFVPPNPNPEPVPEAISDPGPAQNGFVPAATNPSIAACATLNSDEAAVANSSESTVRPQLQKPTN